MADSPNEALRLANRYGGSIPSLRAAPGAAGAPAASAPPQAIAEGSEQARLAKRYPSSTNGGQAVKPDRPVAGRAAAARPVSESRREAPAPTMTPEREALRLAKRYRSLETGAKAPAESSPTAPVARPAPAAPVAESDSPVGEVPASLPPPAWAKDLDYLDHTSSTFQSFAKEADRLGLDDNGRRAIAELYSRDREEQETARVREVEAWRKATESDPEVLEGIPAAKGLLERHGDADLLAMLEESGYGNHPGLARFLVRVAKDLEAARGGRGSR